jgi:hypothetical protein
VRILYIAGLGRSGSTVLDQTLGAQPGAFSVGQFLDVWKHGVLENWRCACGDPFASCAFWSKVRTSDPGLLTSEAAADIQHYHEQTFRLRFMYRLWWEGGRRRILAKTPPSYFDRISRLYRAVRSVSGCETIVDSSKSPGYAHLLIESGVADQIELIHIVRDPRAVAYSSMRRRVDPTSPDSRIAIEPHSVSLTAAMWVEWNTTIERLAQQYPVRYTLLRYEDFVKDPGVTLSRLGLTSGVAASVSTSFAQPHPEWHTVYGNPSRLRSGPIVLRQDNEWRDKLPRGAATTVSVITAPLLSRYGYRPYVRVGEGSSSNA